MSSRTRTGWLRSLARLAYLAVVPVLDLKALPAIPSQYVRFSRDLRRYRRLPGAERVRLGDLVPSVGEQSASHPFDPHYFFQHVWATAAIRSFAPEQHVDVGSEVTFVGGLTVIADVTSVDIRPLPAQLAGLETVNGSVLELPFADRSVISISCLHVLEHIGLGRYGDPLDPEGSRKAAAELSRVLAPGGQLLVSLPVGRRRTLFNAHRIHPPDHVPSMFQGLELDEFAAVADDGRFIPGATFADVSAAAYACGMYRFRRPARDG